MWKWEENKPNKEYGLLSLSVTIYSELIIKIDIKSYFDSIEISSELPSIRNEDCLRNASNNSTQLLCRYNYKGF